jgi:putative heme-binding domain-containing protein
MPDLADVLSQTRFASEPLLRRAISAALRIGDAKRLDLLIQFAQRTDLSESIKSEAIAALSVWAEPSVHDRVDGRYRGVSKRNPELLITKLMPMIPALLKDINPKVKAATIDLVSYLKINNFNKDIIAIKTNDLELQKAVINSLDRLDFDDEASIIAKGIKDKNSDIRALAISKLNTIKADDRIFDLVTSVMKGGSIVEKQSLISTVAKMDKNYSSKIFKDLVGMAQSGQLDEEVLLELEEGLASVDTTLLAQVKSINNGKDELTKFQAALYGGNKGIGEGYFLYNGTGQCTRCHVVEPNGQVTVGPVLKGIGKRLDRNQLLEALVKPSARLAPGYGQIYLKIDDGKEVVGTLMQETTDYVEIKTGDAEPLKMAKSRIKSRESLPSSMPSMAKKMSLRELRDVVEYLASI